MKGQSTEARRARTLNGRCPTHGIKLKRDSVDQAAVNLCCPRRACDYELAVPMAWAQISPEARRLAWPVGGR